MWNLLKPLRHDALLSKLEPIWATSTVLRDVRANAVIGGSLQDGLCAVRDLKRCCTLTASVPEPVLPVRYGHLDAIVEGGK